MMPMRTWLSWSWTSSVWCPDKTGVLQPAFRWDPQWSKSLRESPGYRMTPCKEDRTFTFDGKYHIRYNSLASMNMNEHNNKEYQRKKESIWLLRFLTYQLLHFRYTSRLNIQDSTGLLFFTKVNIKLVPFQNFHYFIKMYRCNIIVISFSIYLIAME